MLRTFLLFPGFFLRLKKEMEKKKLFVQDKIKAIHKTKITASIIKHIITCIHILYVFGKRDERCFSSSPESIFLFPPVFVYSFCVLLVFLFFIQRVVSTELC